MPIRPNLPIADETIALVRDDDVMRQLDDLLRQATTNDGLGDELAATELRNPGGHSAIVLTYERAHIVIVESTNGQGGDTTTEMPTGPTTGDPMVRHANTLDQLRRDGYTTVWIDEVQP